MCPILNVGIKNQYYDVSPSLLGRDLLNLLSNEVVV